ncbi:MAG: hypothetical protein ONB55_21875 [candidate division KSB1 bacterium]|nr:hypothetical protein [candidate division KSB1 bacterium]
MILGIDYSGNAKPHAYAGVEKDKVVVFGSSASIELIFEEVKGYKIEKVYFESPFSLHNKGMSLELAKVTARIEVCCEQRGLEYGQFPGANWQEPLKKAFGVPRKKPVGLSEHGYHLIKYRAYRTYARSLLRNHPYIVTDDEVAAICIASHGFKLLQDRALANKAKKREPVK